MENSRILITGVAGFIGSNLADYFLSKGYIVVGLDNLSTGKRDNIQHLENNSNFIFFEGDICSFENCKAAVKDCEYVLHQAALGSVPRSINDPQTTNNVNITGFLNMLTAARDAQVKRFIYAASSSTYGDSESLPKVESIIGKPLSPYAVTKYVNELYADVFTRCYGMECIGLRYFNVFGRRQDPNGAYAAAIPKFVIQFMNYESPVINGDGNFSRDFTYIDNVIQMNELALTTTNPDSLNNIYNTAFGDRTTLNELVTIIRDELSVYDSKIGTIQITYGPERIGDVHHSLASIEKAKRLLNYNPKFDLRSGLKEAIKWYWENLTKN
jgi:UDP-N-acetylglucosamine 4-epimerase